MEDHKENVLLKLEDAKARGEVDPKMIPVLDLINQSPAYVTTSSCAGRIQLIQLPSPGDKIGSKVIGKWHEPVDPWEVWDSIQRWGGEHVLYLLQEPLIVHVSCVSLKDAIELRNMGDRAGLKHSTIRSARMGKKRIRDAPKEKISSNDSFTVELLSTERLDVPLGREAHLLIQRDYIEFLVELANENLGRVKEKLGRLQKELSGP